MRTIGVIGRGRTLDERVTRLLASGFDVKMFNIDDGMGGLSQFPDRIGLSRRVFWVDLPAEDAAIVMRSIYDALLSWDVVVDSSPASADAINASKISFDARKVYYLHVEIERQENTFTMSTSGDGRLLAAILPFLLVYAEGPCALTLRSEGYRTT